MATRGDPARAYRRPIRAGLDAPLGLGLCRRDRRHRPRGAASRRLAAARRLPVRLHRAGRRVVRRPAPAADARLALPGAGAAGRDRPSARTGRRFLQCDLAGLRRRADRQRARTFRGLDQPGTDAPPHATGVAALDRLCTQRAGRNRAQRSPAARASPKAGVRTMRDLRRGAPPVGDGAGGQACPVPARRMCGGRARPDRA